MHLQNCLKRELDQSLVSKEEDIRCLTACPVELQRFHVQCEVMVRQGCVTISFAIIVRSLT